MYEVAAQVGKNRLFVRFVQKVGPAEFPDLAQQMVDAASRLRAGFAMVMDLQEAEEVHIDPSRAATIAGKLRELGIGRIVRVVGKRAQTALAFERASRQHGFSANLAFSMEEAERLLDGYTE